jgi:hypothetical protein
MTEKNKFVFESFQDFVENILEKVSTGQINEEEGFQSLVSLANKIVGDLKLKGEGKTMATEFFSEMSKYLGQLPKNVADKAISAFAEDVNDFAMSVTDIEDYTESKPVLNTAKTGWKREYVPGTYKYSYAGSVLAANAPTFDADGIVRSTQLEEGPINLYELLGAINADNLRIFYAFLFNEALGKSKYKFAIESLSGKYNMIDDLDVNTIDVNAIEAKSILKDMDEKAGEIVFVCPLYTLGIFQPGAGEPILEEMVEEVIKPAGTSIEVVEKKHSSEGVDFFAENEVKISEAGMKALKAMISQYNNITKITVNGAASSKPTSRAGGNEQLAKDRRKAGIDALNALKKSAPQLKNAEILEGSAEVQQGTKEESDPKMQQVSFIVSGTAKKAEVVDNKEVKITKIENIKGDNIRLWKNSLTVAVNGWGKNPNA